MDSDTPSTARGLLMLMLRPIPTFFMEDLDTTDMLDSDTSDMDTLDMPDSDTESMARGLLMLRLSLILTTSPTVMVTDLDTPDTSDMDTSDMADTTSASRLYQDLSVNHRLNLGQKWIVISLKFPYQCCSFSATIISL